MRGISRFRLLNITSGTGGSNKTMLYFTAPALQSIEIVNCALCADLSVTLQQMTLAWDRITTLGSPTGGTDLTTAEALAEVGSSALGITSAKFGPTSEPTAYAGLYSLGHQAFPSIGGYSLRDTEERIIVRAGTSIGLVLIAGTYASITLSGELVLKAIG